MAMGKGREIGARLHRWVGEGGAGGFSHQALLGRMLDELGAETSLQGPLRDLALRPLFLQALRQEQSALRQSAALSLSRELAEIYAPQVLAELLDLLEAALQVSLPRPAAAGGAARPAPAVWSPAAAPGQEPAADGALLDPRLASGSGSGSGQGAGPLRAAGGAAAMEQRRARSIAPLTRWLQESALALGPGSALAVAAALVIAWLGGELDRLGLDRWHAAPELVVLLLVLQALSAGPLQGWRRQAPLRLELAGDPHQLRRWITSPWLHHRHGEAALNALMLLAILGSSPLPLSQLLLRYALTSLATTALGLAYARRRLQAGVWDGATGAVAALIALAAGLSLLQWRPVRFPAGPLELPAWVLLLTYGALQLGWVLPRLEPGERSAPVQRLLRSSWCWGTVLGLAWALLTRLGQLLGPWLETLQTPAR